MSEHEVSRTLVKSPPELWAECSQASTLARHLDQFGELRITRLEPEIAVAWEGERASGTVRLEPAGWGTRVVLKARPLPDPAVAQTASLTQAAPLIESPPPKPAPLPKPPPRPEDLPPAAEILKVLPAAESLAGALESEAPGERAASRTGFFARLISRFQARPPATRDTIELRQVEPGLGPGPGLRPGPGPGPGPGPEHDPEPSEADPAPRRQLPTRRARPVEIARVYGDHPEDPPPQVPDPPAAAAPDPETEKLGAALKAALDSLGQAHHRPFSRG